MNRPTIARHAHAAVGTSPSSRPLPVRTNPVHRQNQHSPPGNTRHDPAWLILQYGRHYGVPADDPARDHPRINPAAGHGPQQIQCRSQSYTLQNHSDPTIGYPAASPAPAAPDHPKAVLPIDQRLRPAGSCTGGFRTQAPETLHTFRHRARVGVIGYQPTIGAAAEPRCKSCALSSGKLRKSGGRLALGIQSNHSAKIRTTTGCHGVLTRRETRYLSDGWV